MKKSELHQIIKEEIAKVLNEAEYPRDVISTSSDILTTREGKKYKLTPTKPSPENSDFYYDTIMKRIERLDPEDWDIDVKTYKKVIPV
jgi:hypothetical protein